MKPLLKAVLFDLDGTLLDTAPDLAYALNKLLMMHQRQPLPYTEVRSVASHGSRGLLELGFNITKQAPEFNSLKQQLLAIYSDNIANRTQLFPGINDLLTWLTEQNIFWGIVTNKPGWLTEPLLQKMAFPSAPTCVVSGDTVSQAKPAPDSLLHACSLIACSAEDCLYIGDAERDIQAGRSAGMKTLIARYGYLRAIDTPLTWQADGIVDSAADIVDWIKRSY